MNNALTEDIYKFSAKEWDQGENLNWYYFGDRYYDPIIRRFFTPDPAMNLDPKINPYYYCHNIPVNRFDPDGATDWIINIERNHNLLRGSYSDLLTISANDRLASSLTFGVRSTVNASVYLSIPSDV